MKKLLSFLVFFCLSAGVAFAGYETAKTAPAAKEAPKMDKAPKASSAEFNRIKEWAGKWQGTATGHGPEENVIVQYTVTSGGSAVEEVLFFGTPHEMVSMYYENKNGKIGMTHFCSIGNRPHLELKHADANEMDFNWVPGGGVDPKEMHMHSLSITILDKNHLTQTWTALNNGKPLNTATVITLTRAE